jgi:uncharacterized OsmC-like protein
MDATHLKAMQAPLKERYKSHPEAAKVIMKAEGRLAPDLTCRLKTGSGPLVAGLHPAAGGSGNSVCSGDLLLQALVACAGVTLTAVATAIGVNVRDGLITAEGDVDFRGTLGVSKEVPVGMQKIRVNFDLDTDATDEQLASLQKLTERYCVVFQTLRQSPVVDVAFRRRTAIA